MSESTIGSPYGFKGLPLDPETGLLYVRNRYYDPDMGRFISSDPLGFVDGPSQYQFAGNSPIDMADPLGLECLSFGTAADRCSDYVPHIDQQTSLPAYQNHVSQTWNADNSWHSRGASFINSLLWVPLVAAEELGRGIFNSPRDFVLAYEEARDFQDAKNAYQLGLIREGLSEWEIWDRMLLEGWERPMGPGIAAIPVGPKLKLLTRKQALREARRRAGVPRSQSPSRQWTVGDDPSRKGSKNYLLSRDKAKANHGRYYEFDTPNGKRVVADHTSDVRRSTKHTHAGQPKDDPTRSDVDFMEEKYSQIGEKHHIDYQDQ